MAMQECYARSYCKGFDTNICNYECVAYHQLNNIFELSGMPKRYRHHIPLVPENIDRQKFLELKDWITVTEENGKFKHNVIDKVQAGLGLLLWSETKGNGKTSWAAKIMQAYFRAVGLRNNLRTRGIFVNVPELLEQMRNNMNFPTEEHTALMHNLKTVDMVVFDDIGTESPTNWVREQLYIIINKRYSEGLCSIFTSNMSLAQLGHEDVLGDRIASRINGSCDKIEFRGNDRRDEEKRKRSL